MQKFKFLDLHYLALLFFVTLLLFSGCIKCVYHRCLVDHPTQSVVFFAKNTLDYPVLVQCFYRPLNANSDTLWCQKEPVAWSELILINVGEQKIIMDYVEPVHIKIYTTDTVLLLEMLDLRTYPLDRFSDGAVYYSEDALKIGQLIPKKEIQIKDCVEGVYYLKHDRYLLENVPWDIYPIWFDLSGCSDRSSDSETRKLRYAEEANGYARVACIAFNKDAACFQR